MERDEIFWGILSFALACFFSFTVYLLFSSEAFIVALLFDVLVFLGFWELAMKGGNYRKGFVTVFLVFALLAVGLPLGTFESVRMSPDSYVDVSWGAVVLQVQNAGLSTLSIEAVTVGGVTYTTLGYLGERFGLPLERGQNAIVVVYYYSSYQLAFEVGPTVDVTSDVIPRSSWNRRFAANVNVTPLTYLAGHNYPVTIRTQFREHHFVVEARRTSPEDLEVVKSQGWMYKDIEVGFHFELNNTYAWGDYDYTKPPVNIYSLRMGSTTFTFHPSVSVCRSGPQEWEIMRYFDLMWRADGEIAHFFSYHWDGIVGVEPSLNLTSFRPYESYEVTFWTLSNDTYRSSITFLPTP